MVKCKYFNDGFCFSPVTYKTFGEPSKEPVDPKYCLTERYTECRYYSEEHGEKYEFYKYIGIDISKDYYLSIHLVSCENISQCPFYKIIPVDEERGVCVAYCEIFDRYIVRSAVKRCIENWRECPIYKFGQELTG
ncbi:MAG: hypothetical protein B6U89_01710 [Desulfurococcales archaeon ex4484_58]|nr:MAG: hypothetical protein B6U89_01710 [Desulfurococcales archaeon ex4484_58]